MNRKDEILSKATKIKNIYLIEKWEEKKEVLGTYATGLIFETEDGRLIQECSTDCIVPYREVEPNV